jgi:hypothetical protein
MEKRLHLLANQFISTKLVNTQILQDKTLKVLFAGEISDEEKIILDNNQSNPAGGIIADSADFIEMTVDGEVKSDNSRITIPADGITFKEIGLQLKSGDGQSKNGHNEAIILEPDAIGAINKLDGELNDTGAFNFIVGPDVRRGNINIKIFATNFPSYKLLAATFR